MAGLFYFFYKNRNLISSIIAQERDGEVLQIEKKVETKKNKTIGGETNFLMCGANGSVSTESADENREFVKAGDNDLAKWLESLKSSDRNDTSDVNMRIIEIKGTAVTVDAIKFVPISEAISHDKQFGDVPKDVFSDLLKIYYPDPILCITTSDKKEYIMPLDEEYIETSNWISQYGLEMSGEYEAQVICDYTVREEKQDLETHPELEKLLTRVDEFIKEKTNIDLRNGIKAIPIVVYKRIGERGRLERTG